MQQKKSLITKSLNEEKRLATFIVLEPQYEDDMTTDLHSDWYSEEAIAEGCFEFNKSLNTRKGNIYHAVDTTGYIFIESYVLPAEIQIDGQVIRKGTWLQTIYAEADWIWEGIKNGTFNGLSVDCSGIVEDIE